MNPQDFRRAFERDLQAAGETPRLPLQNSLEQSQRAGLESASPADIGLDEDEVEALFAKVKDTGLEAEERAGALQELEIGSLLGERFSAYQARYIEILHGLLDDDAPEVLELTYETLAQIGDELVQERLVTGLEDPAQAKVPPATALNLLAYDDHGAGIGVARHLLVEGDDIEIRELAARLLASDPASAEALADIVENQEEEIAMRTAAAVSLYALNPDRFEAASSNIGSDDEITQTLEAAPRTMRSR